MKILTFAASLRQASWNRKLIAIANQELARIADVSLDAADFREFEMPMYDGDLEDREGIPAGGQKLIGRIRAAGAVVISTPEYNGGIPGTLKNTIDWVSRDDDNPLEGKPVLLIGATPGTFAAVRSLWHTRVPLEAMGAFVFPQMFGVGRAAQNFDAAGAFTDPKNLERLRELLQAFLPYARKLSS